MNISKKKSIRLRNAPLKGARQIGSNMTEVEHGDLTVLYSYETPVAFLSPKGGYVTDKRWSVTTSKHIAKFFDRHGYDRKGAFKVPQDDLAMFVEQGSLAGSEMGAGRVTHGNPRVSVGQRLQVAEGSGLESGRLGIVIKVLPRGVRSPGGLGGHSRNHSVAILRDANGDTFEMFTSHLGEPGKVSFREPWPKERDFPINLDPTPAEMRDVVGRLRRGNPAGQLWYPGGVAVGRYKMGEAGVRYYVIPVESTHGWDFPTLAGMFPDNLRPDGLALLEARLGYEHSGQQGYHLFKIRVGGKWSRPLRLRTSLTELPGVE